MRSLVLLSVTLLSLCSFAAANETTAPNTNRIAVQGALATDGNLGIGIVNYAPNTELGLTLSGSFNNAQYPTQTLTSVIFGGLRKQIGEQTFFAYGINTLGTFGKVNGVSIHSDYAIGPYVSLEQMLTYHFMLSGWIEPYQYQYENFGGAAVSTNSFFAAGGIAINYLF
ncbi:MAG: hypothetical protein Q8R79_04795 [Legionellaceae bacterium]|nr:hypothetical protein [Legionellaceae bacterium]